MNPDPIDIVRQALDNLADQNALAAAKAEIKILKDKLAEAGMINRRRYLAEGERMRRILADLEDVETNAVTKAVIREAIQRWNDALGDGR